MTKKIVLSEKIDTSGLIKPRYNNKGDPYVTITFYDNWKSYQSEANEVI